MEIIYKKIDDLKPYENNPRINDDAIYNVAKSIEEFGFKVPIVLDKNNVIVAGHTRYRASLQLGLKEVPCIIADDLTEQQIKAFRLADNKVSEKSYWDNDLLSLELDDIVDINMEDFGFTEDDIEEDISKEKKEKTLENMEIKSFEHHDYIVFVFHNQMDWLNAVNEFGIKKVDSGYGQIKKVGVGRVIDGKRLLEKIGYKDIDNKQEQI